MPSVSFLGFILAEGEVGMDPEKVQGVEKWPTPTSEKEVQRFLGFANFYPKFIRNFSFIAARVHALTSSKSNFTWNPQAKKAIQHLKKCLISGIAAVLVLLDPSLQFVMEVDVSDLGIGAALSQRSVKGNKSHPGASQIIKIWSISRLPRERVNSH